MQKILIAICTWLLAAGAMAQQRYAPLPANLDGSMMSFDFSLCTPCVIPDTLTPVYASYVARHGSRYLSSPYKLKNITEALQYGRSTATLSDEGDAFFAYIEEIRKANDNHWGDLSETGYKEQALLAERIYDIVTPLHEKNSRVSAVSSYVPRCVMTMYLLNGGIVRENDNLTTYTDEGHQYDRLLCCFTADSLYSKFRKEGAWRKIYDDFVDRNVSPEPARSLFNRTNLSDRKLRELTMDMYEVLKANRAYGFPAPTTRWMSVNEYLSCWKASNLQHYLRNTVSPVSDLAAKATAPLLSRLINNIDRAVEVNDPQPVLEGYFGHAETLLPLFSAMRLPGCYDMSGDYDDLDKNWKIQNITPLGANLLIVVMKSQSGRHYVTMQLNGRTIRPVPGEPDIVPWSMLCEYWKSNNGI